MIHHFLINPAAGKKFDTDAFESNITKICKEEKIDFNTARFFIAEERIGRAEKITAYPPPTYITTALGCVFILALFVCIALFMPEILSFISGLIK